MEVNKNLIQKLQKTIDNENMTKFIQRYHKQACINKFDQIKEQEKNIQTRNIRRLGSKLKQRSVLKRKQSKMAILKQSQEQQQIGEQQKVGTLVQQPSRKAIKDRAIYVNSKQIPYLHSTDLLNHLYKKSSNLVCQQKQQECQFVLYNPPSNNPHALTKVKYLSIYYCKIQSLRDMGTGWSNLIQLSIYFGKLKDLSGLNGFPSIQYLHCPYNYISSISELMFHPTLISIDLESNLLNDINQVQHIFSIQQLQYVNLLNNPVYQDKQNKYIINDKLERVIEQQDNSLDEYTHEQQRYVWQLQNVQGIQYCNSLLREFFILTKHDQITVERKHRICGKSQPDVMDFEAFQLAVGNCDPNINIHKEQVQFRIQYIPAEIPDNSYFQEMIIKGEDIYKQISSFCEQKLFLTPLCQMIDSRQNYIGPVFSKYLMNKLYHLDEPMRNKPRVLKGQRDMEGSQNKAQLKTSKLKRVSRMSRTGFSQSAAVQQSTAKRTQQWADSEEKMKQFQTTTSSLSTNCTNLNATGTTLPFRRSKLTLSKSKQKSTAKISLLKKASQTICDLQTNNFDQNHLHAPSLAKHSRHLMGRSLKKQLKYKFQQSTENHASKPYQKPSDQKIPVQKTSLFTTLKRKNL